MLTDAKLIGIFGGTFDPVHLGHIQLANEVYRQVQLDKLLFIPCHQSPLKKEPTATDQQRLEMLKLALVNYPRFDLDEIELIRQGKSYTIDTLRELHCKYPQQHLCLTMSTDQFAKFNLWHNWEKILKLAHIIVTNRPTPQQIYTPEIKKIFANREVQHRDQLLNNSCGKIIFITMQPNYISATEIRALISKGKDASTLVTTEVWKYICKNKLYSS